MKVVLDTNVLVSGLLNPHGSPGRIVDAVLEGRVRPLFDDRVLGEYREVLARPKFAFDSEDVGHFLDYLEATGEPVVAVPLDVSLPDPDDVPFLEVASAGRASLITGNRDHFKPVRGSHDVRVLPPDAFLKELKQR
ncbi:MAG: putative toxin-antitoxin system toxin component, PIN family [Gemmatimonadota bacterium]